MPQHPRHHAAGRSPAAFLIVVALALVLTACAGTDGEHASRSDGTEAMGSATEPAADLIVGVFSGMTEQEYGLLSQIAPTVAQPAEYNDQGTPGRSSPASTARPSACPAAPRPW